MTTQEKLLAEARADETAQSSGGMHLGPNNVYRKHQRTVEGA